MKISDWDVLYRAILTKQSDFTGQLLRVVRGGNYLGEIPAKPHVKNKLFQMAHARRAKFNSISTSNKE